MWSILALALSALALAAPNPNLPPKPGPDYYRDLTKRIRTEAQFKVPFPGADQYFDYKFELGEPIYPEVKLGDYVINPEKPLFQFRYFWDRIFVKDGSRVHFNGLDLPITCIFVQGQDNRWASEHQNPLFAEMILKITLVVNDFQCVGPINPNWPQNGGKKENWDTFIQYSVKDPTIMLPVDAEIRYRWNEFQAVLVK